MQLYFLRIQNLTAFVNSRYLSDSYQNFVIQSLLLSLSYSFLSCIIINMVRNAEKGGGILMSIILPNFNHSLICPVPVSFPDSGFYLFHTSFRHMQICYRYTSRGKRRECLLRLLRRPSVARNLPPKPWQN